MRILILLYVYFCTFNAHAGGWTSGGGIGVLCNGANGQTVEILDFYEGRLVYKLTQKASVKTLKNELIQVIFEYLKTQSNPTINLDLSNQQYYEYTSNLTEKMLSDFQKNSVFINPSQTLPPSNDATMPKIPPTCKFVQIALANPNGTILLDPKYWNQMDDKNKAGLILHESIYATMRDSGDRSSDITRHFIAMLFSRTPPFPRFFDAPKTGVKYCNTRGSMGTDIISFYYYYSPFEKGFVMNFNQMGNAGYKFFRTIVNLGQKDILSNSIPFHIEKMAQSQGEPNRNLVKVSSNVQTQYNIEISAIKLQSSFGGEFSCR